VDERLRLTKVDESRRQDIDGRIRDLMGEMSTDEALDPEVRTYLLSVAVHLRAIVEHFGLFGVDGIDELQVRFVLDLLRTHPDWLQDLTTEASQSEEAAVRGKTYVRRIWQIIGVASALVGLPADVIALAGAAGELMSGH
jgi:ElaB/YqjD/DUF883 family membrane-anchored ribosome-binding protein